MMQKQLTHEICQRKFICHISLYRPRALLIRSYHLQGRGAVAMNNLMEDAATAEISRGQLWQWLRHSVMLENGEMFTPNMFKAIRTEELQRQGGSGKGRLQQAAEILDHLVLSSEMEEFLTLPAYKLLDNPQAKL